MKGVTFSEKLACARWAVLFPATVSLSSLSLCLSHPGGSGKEKALTAVEQVSRGALLCLLGGRIGGWVADALYG